MTRVIEILLTGGSCAGKTTALPLVSRSLRERGVGVLTAPEAVTLLVSAGIPQIGEVSRTEPNACIFQRQVLAVQRQLRRSFPQLASLVGNEVVVILYDRGELDGQAYHPHDCIDKGLATENETPASVIASYDAIMHLVTTADGAVDAFSLSNNPARWDDLEEARVYDRRLQDIYRSHPHHLVIDNSTDFIGKVERLAVATMALPGVAPKEPETSYTLDLPVDESTG